MFFKRIQPRKFNYIPRFYDPAKDKDKNRDKRIDFGLKRKRKPRSPLFWLLLLVAVIYFYWKLEKISSSEKKETKTSFPDKELIDSVKKIVPSNSILIIE